MTPKQQAVIFDWNGTILADTVCCLHATNVVLSIFELPSVTLEEYREAYTIPFQEMYKTFGCHERLMEGRQDELIQTFSRAYERRSLRARARKGAEMALTYLRDQGKTTAILSNYKIPKIKEQAQRLGLLSYFDAILANENNEEDPFHLRSKGERLKHFVDAHETQRAIIVGDSIEEIEIAQHYGYVSVALTEGTCSRPRLRKANPDFLISSLEELPDITKKVFG